MLPFEIEQVICDSLSNPELLATVDAWMAECEPSHNYGVYNSRCTLGETRDRMSATMRTRAAAVLELPEDSDAPAAVKAFLAALPATFAAAGVVRQLWTRST